MDNQNLFSQTYSQILSNAVGSGNPNFQLIGNPIDFNWPVAATGQVPQQAYMIANAMPKWSPVGSYNASDVSFFSAYSRVFSLMSYKVSPEKQNDLNNLWNQVTAAQNQLNNIATNANTAYLTAQQNGGPVFAAMYPTIADWLKGPGSTYQTQITNQTASVNTLSNQYTFFVSQFCTDPTLQNDAKTMALPTGTPGATPAPPGWTKVLQSDGSLAWGPLFNIGTTGQDWRGKLTQGTQGGFTIELDAAKSDSDIEKSFAGASFSYDAFFWGVNASGSWERATEIDSDSSVTATVTVESSTLVPVVPAPSPAGWYDSGLMSQLAKNQLPTGISLADGWTATGGQGSQCVFGQYGLLSTRVSGLVVVYKPSYSITMQSSTYNAFHQKFSASFGLRIGPFTFGGSGGHETTKVSTTGNRTTLTSTSTSDDPLIIGITVAFPGTDQA
jgi:hypothetical protein